MKQKGFTLIELLAVIVILAIIALIATPIILNIISDAKQKAEMRSVENVIHAAELYNAKENLNAESNIGKNIYSEVIEMVDGQIPDEGTIYVNESGKIAIALKYVGNCYTKEYGSEEIKVEETDICRIPINFLMVNPSTKSGDTTFLGNSVINRNQVEKIVMEDTITNIPTGAYSWDVSEAQNGSVMAWYLDGDNDDLYELYIGQEGGVIANPNSNTLFNYFTKVTEIDLDKFDTSYVTTMAGMFNHCEALKTLNLSNFKTYNVTTMRGMFQYCSSLTELDLSNFNTDNVTTMRTMFQYCSSLTELDLSNFNTDNVTDMSLMFSECNSLTQVDVSSFNTSKVTTMFKMFVHCQKLQTLNLSNFNTNDVTDMSWMFGGSTNLEKIYVTSETWKKPTTIDNMFIDCSATVIDKTSGEIITW